MENATGMGNLELYQQFRTVPDNAQRAITGGRLKGKTEINPMSVSYTHLTRLTRQRTAAQNRG